MTPKRIGLVGGVSWVSTLDYYRLINEGVNERLGGLNFATCIIDSLDFGAVQARGWLSSYELLLDACRRLQRSDVDAIALCANTAHMFADELEAAVGVPLIHIVTATAAAVTAAGHHCVGLLGTRFTMELPFYRAKLEAHGLRVLTPPAQETRDYVQETVMEELGRGIVRPETKARYIAIADDLAARGAEALVLGCTEIPMLIGPRDLAMPVFDTTTIHARAIVDYALA